MVETKQGVMQAVAATEGDYLPAAGLPAAAPEKLTVPLEMSVGGLTSYCAGVCLAAASVACFR